ncbi:MAG: LysR family transcriptional regulator [Burkholderiales bacterium]|jgi:LysR family transcriptional regulator for metE and metH|nr:LysR family transcriptional regulator [Burkholderiales bacterium]
MIELRHLRSLAAIADTGKLVHAASQVHLTQSALSHQMRALEEHYGAALFQRTGSGLRFTPAGQRLLQLARDTLLAVADAERDLLRLKGDPGGDLRIALECHTCFDWLMPVMDAFRGRWPEVEVDLLAGFHSDPLALLQNGKAELVIGSQKPRGRDYVALPLFRFEILAVLPVEHRLRTKRRIEAADLKGETLITYPVPEERIDLIRQVLKPAGIQLKRRTAELTVAILQLVASRRGIAALPNWGVRNYVDLDYVIARRIGAKGLWSELHAVVPRALASRPYVTEFVDIIRSKCAAGLDGIELL